MAKWQDERISGLPRELGAIGRLGRRAWGLVPAGQKWALAAALVIMAVGSSAATAIPLYLGKLVDAVNPETHRSLGRESLVGIVCFYLAAIGLAYVIREGLNVLRRFLVENACTRIDKEMCVRLVAHLMKVDLSSLSREQVGSLHGRITRSVEGFVRFLRLSFLDFCPAMLTGAFALAAALSKEPRIALAMAGVIPGSVALTAWQVRTQKGVRLQLLRSREEMDGTVVEQLTGLDYIRTANTFPHEVRRVASVAEQRRSKELRHHFEMSMFGSGKALNEGFFHLLVIAFAVYLFLHGAIRYGDILAFSVLFLNVMSPLNEIHRFVDEAHESSLRVGDLVDVLDEPVDRSFRNIEVRDPKLAMDAPVFVADDIHVEYSANDGQTKRALNGVSMTIRHGETIGVAGPSGGGKSTWLRVMMRLTHPCWGSATLGGVPLDLVSRETIGRLIGYVGQNPFIFAGSIAENIAYGTPDASRDAIERAARLACIYDEIVEMPGAFDAPVLERGQNLSGGQRQRLALARVFLKNPPILILDEGTSALDNINERHVQRAISAARADRTVILVAHRLTTLRDADRIFVFNEGRIAEVGSFDALVRSGGVFTDLVESASAGLLPLEGCPVEDPAQPIPVDTFKMTA
jgi:ATP-binding cassette subfamily B protein